MEEGEGKKRTILEEVEANQARAREVKELLVRNFSRDYMETKTEQPAPPMPNVLDEILEDLRETAELLAFSIEIITAKIIPKIG